MIRLRARAAIPVLTYHAMRVEGSDYSVNDHIALAEDLKVIHRLGLRIVPLQRLVDALLNQSLEQLRPSVAITFDDGSDLDWYDIAHPSHGVQRSMAGILEDFARTTGRTDVHATTFVIASPEARKTMDRTCMLGRGWWQDAWWPAAAANGLAIENHSWDHNHSTLRRSLQRHNERGTFSNIETLGECDGEIRQATEYINQRIGSRGRCTLLAYPYGECSAYLAEHYLPNQSVYGHGIRAAFTTEPAPLDGSRDRWRLPRYVCGEHWRSPAALREILRDTLRGR